MEMMTSESLTVRDAVRIHTVWSAAARCLSAFGNLHVTQVLDRLF